MKGFGWRVFGRQRIKELVPVPDLNLVPNIGIQILGLGCRVSDGSFEEGKDAEDGW